MAFIHDIYIADDHEAVRYGMRAALSFSEFRVVAQCCDHDEVLARVRHRVPDALVLDFAMPGCQFADGLGYIGYLHARYPSLPIMVFTMTRRVVLLQAMRDAGAMALVDKGATAGVLPMALRRIIAGEMYISESFLRLTEPDASPDAAFDDREIRETALTEQEALVVASLGEGSTLAEVSRLLGRSISTVSTLKRRAMRKLSIRSMHDLRDYGRRL